MAAATQVAALRPETSRLQVRRRLHMRPCSKRRQCLLAAIAASSTACVTGAPGGARLAATSCATSLLPNLPTCFDMQPSATSSRCYTIRQEVEEAPPAGVVVDTAEGTVADSAAQTNGTGNSTNSSNVTSAPTAPAPAPRLREVVRCAYEKDNISDGNVLECKDGVWEAGASTGLGCQAAPQSVWRIVNTETTSRGWWLHAVQFFTDTSCRNLVPGAAVAFDFGPAGSSSPDSIAQAFDGNPTSFWRAPCIAGASYDLCGCKAYLGEGWSTTLHRCVNGVRTDGDGEQECAERIQQGLQSPVTSDVQGCPAQTAAIGVQLGSPADIGCVRVMQYDASGFSSGGIALQAWSEQGWIGVKQWKDLRQGAWETLRVHEGCASYRVEPGEWIEVAGYNGAAGHGEARVLRCLSVRAGGGLSSGASEGLVRCINGRWSLVKALSGCEEPELPTQSFFGNTRRSPALDGEIDPAFGLAFIFLALVFGTLVLCTFLFIMRWYLRRRTWRMLVKHGAAPPGLEEQAQRTRELYLRYTAEMGGRQAPVPSATQGPSPPFHGFAAPVGTTPVQAPLPKVKQAPAHPEPPAHDAPSWRSGRATTTAAPPQRQQQQLASSRKASGKKGSAKAGAAGVVKQAMSTDGRKAQRSVTSSAPLAPPATPPLPLANGPAATPSSTRQTSWRPAQLAAPSANVLGASGGWRTGSRSYDRMS
eukprot:TRINITY_DN744_c6_g1_i2.p1 TRINITY_DN744_c6_g1~~TRINITY_DN744_c6_g1_i2.p1  ORF type:complete len:703 (-),score=107.09 TRINITY_DN744_c6_g1_i2:241-2349(-)